MAVLPVAASAAVAASVVAVASAAVVEAEASMAAAVADIAKLLQKQSGPGSLPALSFCAGPALSLGKFYYDLTDLPHGVGMCQRSRVFADVLAPGIVA